MQVIVLIESDWNLKGDKLIGSGIATIVLIESDWNLKTFKEKLAGTASAY